MTNTKESEEETKIAEVDGQEAGVIHKSEGKGVFADAVEGVTASKGESVNGVQIGTPGGSVIRGNFEAIRNI